MFEGGKRYTKAGTDIEQVKRQNAAAGPGFNELLASLGERSNAKEEIAEDLMPKKQPKKTVAGTDIEEVRRQNKFNQ